MDSFIKNIKKKLSVDNLVDMMKDSKVINEDAMKEAEVRNTLSKLDPDSVMDVDDMAGKLSEISEASSAAKSKVEISTGQKIVDAAKSGIGVAKTSIGLKSSEMKEEPPAPATEDDYLKALGREENVFKLYDDFN